MESFLFTVHCDNTRQLVWTTATGPLSREGFIRMVTAARRHSGELGWPLLYDMRQMYLPDQLLLNEVISFVKGSLGNDGVRQVRSASLVVRELLGEEIWDIYRFASRLAGLEWALFTDEQQAIRWLKSS